MKLGITLCLILVGCGTNYGSLSNPPPNEQGRVDAGAPIHDPPSGLCCQVENNETDSALWNNGRYDCLPLDAGLQPFNPPWICQVNQSGMCGGTTGIECLNCNMPSCVVGMNCLAPNGTGVVLPCDQQDW